LCATSPAMLQKNTRIWSSAGRNFYYLPHMKALLIIIIGVAFAFTAKPNFSKQQWETIMDAQYAYATDTTPQKLNTLITVSLPLKGMSKQQIEYRLDVIYGPQWKTVGDGNYEVCRFICGIIFLLCDINHKWCTDNYWECINFCRSGLPAVK
jgi:hypothetical protein